MSKEIRIYRGLLITVKDFNGHDSLHLLRDGKANSPLAQEIFFPSRNKVSVNYLISDKEIPENEIELETLKFIEGFGETTYGATYSELTGYLWTNEELKVGGHNLLQELFPNIGKYLHMSITIN